VVYHYEFQHDGQNYRGTTGRRDKRDAQTFERTKRAEAESGALRNVAGHTVRDIFDRYYRSHGQKLAWKVSLKPHMMALEDFFGPNTRFIEITTKDVSAALDAYAATTERKNRRNEHTGRQTVRPGSPTNSTVNRRLAVFRGIYLKARDEWELPVGFVNFKKLARKEPKERVRHITKETAQKLLRELGGQMHIALMMGWSLANGCRLGETETLRWDRVNYDTNQAEVFTKGGGTRFVDLNADAFAILAMCDRNRTLVFDSTNRRKIWEAAVKAVGLEDFHWHDLRHTFATWLGDLANDITVVMTALGHSQIATTMKYRHVIRANVKAGVAKLPTLIDEPPVVRLKRPERRAEAYFAVCEYTQNSPD
jgi:integrase